MTATMYSTENGEPDFTGMTSAQRQIHMWLEAEDETPTE